MTTVIHPNENEGRDGGLPDATCSRSYTPESDKLAETLIYRDSLTSFRKYIKRSLKVCRKLEREMHEWKAEAERWRDMYMQFDEMLESEIKDATEKVSAVMAEVEKLSKEMDKGY